MMDCRSMATPMISNLKKKNEAASNSNLVDPTMYKQLVGSLMYLVNTRPDIYFSMSTLSQFMSEPRKLHWVVAKHVLRYLRGTIGYGLRYFSSGEVMLQGYTDSDWARSADDRKSTSGTCLGSTIISWISRKQKLWHSTLQRQSTLQHVMLVWKQVWLSKLISELFDQVLDSTVIFCDNQSCVKLSENPVFHDRSKHIEIKYYYICDRVQKGEVKLQYISTDEQITDILMKHLSKGKFVYFRDKLGLVEIAPLVEREC
jgi:hypothetical protein